MSTVDFFRQLLRDHADALARDPLNMTVFGRDEMALDRTVTGMQAAGIKPTPSELGALEAAIADARLRSQNRKHVMSFGSRYDRAAEAAAYAFGAIRKLCGDESPKLLLDAARRTATLAGETYALTDDQFEVLSAIYNGGGAWVVLTKGRKGRPDRIIKKLPAAIQSRIESKRGCTGGYRWLEQ